MNDITRQGGIMAPRQISPRYPVISVGGVAVATEDIETGSVVEAFPVILVPQRGRISAFNDDRLIQMAYFWDREQDTICFAMGYGSQYRFSDDANVDVIPDQDSRMIVATATRKILKGEPISRSRHFLDQPINSDVMSAISLPDHLDVNPVEVRKAQWGLGIFATRDIAAGEVVEECPAVPYRGVQPMVSSIGRTSMNRYVFKWRIWEKYKESGEDRYWPGAVSLGYGGIYNHSSKASNSEFHCDYDDDLIIFTATSDISAGEEILHNYGWGDGDPRLK